MALPASKFETYASRLEQLLLTQTNALLALKDKVSTWRREMRQEEEISREDFCSTCKCNLPFTSPFPPLLSRLTPQRDTSMAFLLFSLLLSAEVASVCAGVSHLFIS
ncbi:hypothetical protein ECG_08696 [Echinococcus granulosus]|nr:hypothetical protein ECG_08696 [Echinococcus granulosus]